MSIGKCVIITIVNKRDNFSSNIVYTLEQNNAIKWIHWIFYRQ